MPDLPAPDAHDPHAEFVAELRRLLGDPRFQASALNNVLDYAQAAAFAAWEDAEGQEAHARLSCALGRASEVLLAFRTTLAAGPGTANGRAEG